MTENLTAVILASGLGTRLKPITDQTPKPLVEVGGKYLIEYTLANLQKAGVAKVIITTRPFGEQFPEKLGSSYQGMELVYRQLPEDSEPLGVAGDLKTTEELLPETEPFLVCNSDIVTDLDLRAFYESHRRSGCPASLALIKKDPQDYPSGLGLDGEGRLAQLNRNVYGPVRETYTFACYHVLKKELLAYIPAGKFWGFFGDDDLYPTLIQKGIPINVFICPAATYWEDVGTMERLKKVEGGLQDQKRGPSNLG